MCGIHQRRHHIQQHSARARRASGARLNAAALTNGTVSDGRVTTSVLLSRDGRAVAFGNNATNLLGGVSSLGGAGLHAYRKLVP